MITSNVELSEKDKALFNYIIEDLKKEGKEVTLDNLKAHSLFDRLEQKGIFVEMIPISISISREETNSFSVTIAGTGLDFDDELHKAFLIDKVSKLSENIAGFVKYIDKTEKKLSQN